MENSFSIDVVVLYSAQYLNILEKYQNCKKSLLQYQIKSIKFFMSWARKIFLVTPNSAEFKSQFENDDSVSIVNYSNIIPKDLNNQSTITAGLFLHKIKQLSENFILLTQNMLMTYYSNRQCWFDINGKPNISFIWRCNYNTLNKNAISIYEHTQYNNMECVNQICTNKYYIYKYFKPVIAPISLRKSIVKEVWEKAGTAIEQSILNDDEKSKIDSNVFALYMQQMKLCNSNDNDLNIDDFFKCFKAYAAKQPIGIDDKFYKNFGIILNEKTFIYNSFIINKFISYIESIEKFHYLEPSKRPAFNVDYNFNAAFAKQFDKGVDIVYVVGKQTSCADNFCLRASLRSVEKYATNINRIIVVGYPPDWLSDEVIKISCPDATINGVTGKHWNILNCIKTAIETCGLDKPFLYSSDDHFFLKHCDLAYFPRYCASKTMPSRSILMKTYRTENPYDVMKWGEYQDMIADTREMLEQSNLPYRMACCHHNTWMDPKYLQNVLDVAYKHKELNEHYGFEPTCMFNAFFERDNPTALYKKVENNDRKIINVSNFDEITNVDQIQFSSHQLLDKNYMFIKKLFNFYPTKSKYENNDTISTLIKNLQDDKIKLQNRINIAIAFICIGNNASKFNDFYSSAMQHFCKECNRTFIVLTDSPKQMNQLDNCITYRIDNPIYDESLINFRKFKYLMMAEDRYLDFDYVCYIDTNAIFQKDISFDKVANGKDYAVIQKNALHKQSNFIFCKSSEFLRLGNQIEIWRLTDILNTANEHIDNLAESYYAKYIKTIDPNRINYLNSEKYLCLNADLSTNLMQ